MSTNTPLSRIARQYTTDDRAVSSVAWPPLAVLLLHGPLDVAITLSAPQLESNPVVHALGWELWLAIKPAVLAGAVAVWYDAHRPPRYDRAARVWLAVLLAFGLVAVLGNLAVLWWVGA